MRKIWVLPVLGLVLACPTIAGPPAQKAAAARDNEALARTLVQQCAAVRENDFVVIAGGPREIELLENLAVQVRKLGAHPLVSFGSERLTRRLYEDVPTVYDAQIPAWDQKLAEVEAALISVDLGADPSLLAHVPAERITARGKAYQPVNDLVYQRNVHQVFLGNGLYPSDGLARQFGVPKAQLEKIFWDGVNVDYATLQATGEGMKAALVGGRELRITNPNGTDLRLRIEGRPVSVSDGVISADDARKGGADCQVWLPAGEVYLSVVPGTAEGRVVADHHYYQGKDIEGLTLAFKAGKLVAMTARSGLEPLQKLYDASSEGRDLFGIVDFGINHGVKLPAGTRMTSWVPAGMITVTVGNDQWAGGTNTSTFGPGLFLPGSTATLDGRVIVKNGALESGILGAR